MADAKHKGMIGVWKNWTRCVTVQFACTHRWLVFKKPSWGCVRKEHSKMWGVEWLRATLPVCPHAIRLHLEVNYFLARGSHKIPLKHDQVLHWAITQDMVKIDMGFVVLGNMAVWMMLKKSFAHASYMVLRILRPCNTSLMQLTMTARDCRVGFFLRVVDIALSSPSIDIHIQELTLDECSSVCLKKFGVNTDGDTAMQSISGWYHNRTSQSPRCPALLFQLDRAHLTRTIVYLTAHSIELQHFVCVTLLCSGWMHVNNLVLILCLHKARKP